MYERFTDRAKKVMQIAQHEAQRLRHEAVSTEHVLLGLARDSSGVAANVLKKLEVDFHKVRAETEKVAPARKPGKTATEDKLPLSPATKQLIEFAREEATQLGHNHVGTEHLLLGLVRVSEGAAPRVLANVGVKPEAIRDEVLRVLGHVPADAPAPASPAQVGAVPGAPVLPLFTHDLTALAKEGKLDPCVGRAAEIDEMVQILSCRGRNRLLLVGPAGVGKRSLLRGLAARLASDAVPEGFPTRLLRLELPLLLVNQGELSPVARLHAILSETRAQGGILAVEGLPLLFETWDGSLGGLFRAWVSSEPGPLIALATTQEARRLEEREPGLLEQFETLPVAPPTLADALAVVQGVRPLLEAHHRIKISDEALAEAVELAERVPGVGLPGSAVRLLDRAAARVRQKTAVRAPGVQTLNAEIARLEREKEDAVGSQDFEKAAALRDQAEKLKARREEAVREWESVAGPVPTAVDAAGLREMLAHLTR